MHCVFFLELLLDQHCQARCHSSRQQAGPRSSFSIHAVRTTKSVVRWHEARRAMATRDSSRFASRYAGRTPGTARAASLSATVFLAFRCRERVALFSHVHIVLSSLYLNCCAARTRDWIRSVLQRPSMRAHGSLASAAGQRPVHQVPHNSQRRPLKPCTAYTSAESETGVVEERTRLASLKPPPCD